ncbi:MAG TPA: sigma-54-dependent Fis family transcriptional regulator [Thiotrichales bacterium]|nr:sigma-54-dependent Fis family transcriptional regulator [Thiotrichales bacterium]
MFGSDNNDAFGRLLGSAPAIESVIRTAQIAAATDVHVLIEGETGTGKELMARAIQQSSTRADRPFIIINCAALPAELVESLLFGHEKGAFTGATECKDGYIQKAHGGTLFLDEIGELPLALQAKLLRFVENGECQRLGSHQSEIIDARIIAATHRNLPDMVKQGSFRQDLFYRLCVVDIRMPPLRERTRDIPMLATFFLNDTAKRNKQPPASFSSGALKRFRHYHWPGNVRELKNVCEHVSALMPGEIIHTEQLPGEIRHSAGTGHTGFTLPEEGIDMESLEIDLLQQALAYTGGNKSRAAKLLGLSRDAFLYRLKKHGLS